MSNPTPNPTLDANGLPLCNQEGCGLFDGKRCSAIGFRPDRFCEPAMVEIVAEHNELKATAARIDAAAVEIRHGPTSPEPACRHPRRSLRPDAHGNPATTCIDCGDEIP